MNNQNQRKQQKPNINEILKTSMPEIFTTIIVLIISLVLAGGIAKLIAKIFNLNNYLVALLSIVLYFSFVVMLNKIALPYMEYYKLKNETNKQRIR